MEAIFLSRLKEELSKCNRCGVCLACCPVFLETNEEWFAARGRMALLEAAAEGRINKTPFFKNSIFSCLYCHTCVENCPSRVGVDEFILSARQELSAEQGLPLISSAGFEIIKRKKLLDSGIKTIHFLDKYSPLFLKKIFVSLLGQNKSRVIPSPSAKSLSQQLPEKISVKNPKMQVAFFTGCLIEYLYPKIGTSLVNILIRNNIEVIIPREQYCCGIPLLTSGDKKGAEYLAQKNIELFSQLDVSYIVNACATCGSTLKDYEKLFGNWKLENRNWKNKIYDISEFLVKFTDLKFKTEKEAKITYHDPCHLRKRQHIFEEPRTIIKSLNNIEFVEMNEPDRCCGSGGLFSFKYYDISKKIAEKKIENANQTKAEYIVTACPGCILHLNDILTQNKSKQRAIHLTELLI
ncbi:MAG: (Fe-S)-binding protein [Candidatus Aminicenantia bacterium]